MIIHYYSLHVHLPNSAATSDRRDFEDLEHLHYSVCGGDEVPSFEMYVFSGWRQHLGVFFLIITRYKPLFLLVALLSATRVDFKSLLLVFLCKKKVIFETCCCRFILEFHQLTAF